MSAPFLGEGINGKKRNRISQTTTGDNHETQNKEKLSDSLVMLQNSPGEKKSGSFLMKGKTKSPNPTWLHRVQADRSGNTSMHRFYHLESCDELIYCISSKRCGNEPSSGNLWCGRTGRPSSEPSRTLHFQVRDTHRNRICRDTQGKAEVISSLVVKFWYLCHFCVSSQ